MGGGPASLLCAHCGGELRAGSRFCRTCGQSVPGHVADPAPFPDLPPLPAPADTPGPGRPEIATLNLPGGGPRPHDPVPDTIAMAAIPPLGDTPSWTPPADHRPAAYQPPEYPATEYAAQGPSTPGYAATEYPATEYPATEYVATENAAPGYAAREYPATAYQPADQRSASYQPADQRSAGYPGAEYQPGSYPPPGYPPPGQLPPPDGGSRRRIIVGVLAVIVAVGGVAAGLLIARAHAPSGQAAGPGHSAQVQSSGSPAARSSGSGSPGSAPPSSAAASAEQQGADNLSALLSQSVSDRGTINNAYNDVASCGPTLAQDQGTFQQAVTSRQSLLSRLGSMPDAAALPAGMISSLTQAWQASITADQDFAAWAKDESANCTPNGSDANLSAATVPDNQATRDKTAFVSSWNPIAQQYGLPTYAQDQL